MKKLLRMAVVVGMGLALSGCASYMTYKGSEKQVAMKKALILADPAKIKALEAGEEPDKIGIDVGPMEVLSQRPYRQAGAGILDAGLAYLAKEGLDSIGGDDDNSDAKSNSADKNVAGANNIITQGNNNTISINTSTAEGNGQFDGQAQDPSLVPAQ